MMKHLITNTSSLTKFSTQRSFSQTNTNLYKILGISTTATSKQIKQSFYEKAKIYHPDVSKDPKANQIFSQISKAYQVLSDVQRKAEYDRDVKPGQHQWATRGFKAGQRNSQSQNTSKGYKGFQSRTSQKRHKSKLQEQDFQPFESYDTYYGRNKHHLKAKKGQDIHINLSISLKQSVQGIKKSIKFTKTTYCEQCSSNVFKSCFPCGGKGTIFNRNQRQKQFCKTCQGKGYKNECSSCSGSGQIIKDVDQFIFVEKNTHNRSILRIQGRGNQGFRHDNGDLYVTVLVEESQELKVDGNNVHSQHSIDYLTAVFGGKVQVQTVRGKRSVQIQPGTQSGRSIRLFNQGLVSQFSKRRGDHVKKYIPNIFLDSSVPNQSSRINKRKTKKTSF